MHTVRLSDGSEFGPADLDTLVQWAREGRVPRDALLVPADGGGEVRSVFAEPRLAAILNAPPTVATKGAASAGNDSYSGVIPYKNPAALTGYYLGLFSCFPVLGIILGPAAIYLGIRGLRQRSLDPARKGSAHAWIAIICGIIGLLIGLFFALGIALAIADRGP